MKKLLYELVDPVIRRGQQMQISAFAGVAVVVVTAFICFMAALFLYYLFMENTVGSEQSNSSIFVWVIGFCVPVFAGHVGLLIIFSYFWGKTRLYYLIYLSFIFVELASILIAASYFKSSDVNYAVNLTVPSYFTQDDIYTTQQRVGAMFIPIGVLTLFFFAYSQNQIRIDSLRFPSTGIFALTFVVALLVYFLYQVFKMVTLVFYSDVLTPKGDKFLRLPNEYSSEAAGVQILTVFFVCLLVTLIVKSINFILNATYNKSGIDLEPREDELVVLVKWTYETLGVIVVIAALGVAATMLQHQPQLRIDRTLSPDEDKNIGIFFGITITVIVISCLLSSLFIKLFDINPSANDALVQLLVSVTATIGFAYYAQAESLMTSSISLFVAVILFMSIFSAGIGRTAYVFSLLCAFTFTGICYVLETQKYFAYSLLLLSVFAWIVVGIRFARVDVAVIFAFSLVTLVIAKQDETLHLDQNEGLPLLTAEFAMFVMFGFAFARLLTQGTGVTEEFYNEQGERTTLPPKQEVARTSAYMVAGVSAGLLYAYRNDPAFGWKSFKDSVRPESEQIIQIMETDFKKIKI